MTDPLVAVVVPSTSLISFFPHTSVVDVAGVKEGELDVVVVVQSLQTSQEVKAAIRNSTIVFISQSYRSISTFTISILICDKSIQKVGVVNRKTIYVNFRCFGAFVIC